MALVIDAGGRISSASALSGFIEGMRAPFELPAAQIASQIVDEAGRRWRVSAPVGGLRLATLRPILMGIVGNPMILSMVAGLPTDTPVLAPVNRLPRIDPVNAAVIVNAVAESPGLNVLPAIKPDDG